MKKNEARKYFKKNSKTIVITMAGDARFERATSGSGDSAHIH